MIVFKIKVGIKTPQNIERESVLVLTKDHIYLLYGQQVERRILITALSAIIKSSVSSECLFVIPNSKDLHILTIREEDFDKMR